MEDLLRYSLDRISALQKFYALEKDSIGVKAKTGMEHNLLGFAMEQFFRVIVYAPEDKQLSEMFQELKSFVAEFVDYDPSIKKSGNRYVITYRYKNQTLLEENGVETNIQKSASEYKQYEEMPRIHSENTLIMLIVRFEEFLTNFFCLLYNLYPEKYIDKQQIIFSEIRDISVEEVRKKIILREVGNLMRKSYTEWFKLINSHGIDLKCIEEIEVLEELYARRNILVHNSGFVNQQYITSVPKTTLKIGDKLTADEVYLDRAFLCVQIIIFSIHIASEKLVKDGRREYINYIFNILFERLQNEEYKLCKVVYKFLYESKGADSSIRLMSRINYWIAERELYGIDSIREEVESYDMCSSEKIYVLAKELLLDNYEVAMRFLENLYVRGDVTSFMIKHWPLFKNFRKSDWYSEFVKGHMNDFEKPTLELDSEFAKKQPDGGDCQ